MSDHRAVRAEFEALYQKHRSYVFMLCCKMLHNEDDAWDAVQEIFYRKWRSFAAYDPNIAKFVTFLSGNTHKYLIERWRKQQHLAFIAGNPIEEWPEEVGEVEDDIGDITVLRALVDECLAELTPPDRQLVMMRFIEEYTLHEILSMRRDPQHGFTAQTPRLVARDDARGHAGARGP